MDINEVRQLQQAGQLSEAEKACRTILQQAPEFQDIQVLLALVLTQQQQADEANTLIDINVTPEATLVVSDMGLLCILRGELERAGELLEYACHQPIGTILHWPAWAP